MSRTICFLLCYQIFYYSPIFAEEGVINFGVIRYIKGEVFHLVKGEKAKVPVKVMDRFYDGAEISTGENSFAILKLPDGSTMKLDPLSSLKVEGLIEKKGESYKGTSYFVLSIGGVMVDVVKKFAGPPSLEVETVNQVAFGVRGTTFYIFHDQETNDVWGTVHQGEVLAMDYMNDDSESINAGMAMAIVEGQILTKAYKYHWAEKIKWSFIEKESELDTRRISSTEERLKELQSLFKKIRQRTKKNFAKEKQAQKASLGDEYRTSTGEYESHDANLFPSTAPNTAPGTSENSSSSVTPGKDEVSNSTIAHGVFAHASVNSSAKVVKATGASGVTATSTPTFTTTPSLEEISDEGSGSGSGTFKQASAAMTKGISGNLCSNSYPDAIAMPPTNPASICAMGYMYSGFIPTDAGQVTCCTLIPDDSNSVSGDPLP